MIPFPFWPRFKSKWLAAQEARLAHEYAPRLASARETLQRSAEALTRQQEALTAQAAQQAQQERSLTERQETLTRAQRDVEDLVCRAQDRRVELTKVQEELKTQIRLTEAKAAPDALWVAAFSRGYEKAWETLAPTMLTGLQHTKQTIEQQAIDATLTRLQSIVLQKAEQLGQCVPPSLPQLLDKQQEFQQKLSQARTAEERMRYTHYLTALDWMLHANGLHPDQPRS